jgi:hypothetical protein
MNFGLLLTSTMNDKNKEQAKRRFIGILNKLKEQKLKTDEDKFEKLNDYLSKYEKKREMNNEIYMNYYQTFIQLKEYWLKSGKENDLEKLKNLKKPELIDIDDIYTSMYIKNKRFKN